MNAHPLLQAVDAHRPIPFYFITSSNPADLSAEAALRQMTMLKENGFGGCVFFNKPPHGFTRDQYLAEPWFEAVRNFAEASRRLGLALWINDGFDFPPGDAGGRIEAVSPDLKQRRLARDANGKPAVVEVPWGFPAFEEPESSRLFIQFVYEAHLKHVGDYFGNGITGFFSDADCRRVNYAIYLPDAPQQDYFPWSKDFPEVFRREYGYEIAPFLDDLLDRKPCRATTDYWRLTGRLYAQWFANNHAWCRRHGLRYTFHTSDSGPFALRDCLRSSIYSEGRIFELLEHSDYPGTDHELRTLAGGTPNWGDFYLPRASWGGTAADVRPPAFYTTRGDVRAKQAASVAFLNGRRGAMCEMFAATNWGATPEDLRIIAAWQIMQGITFIVPHAVHQRLHGSTKYFAPPDFSPATSLGWSIRALNDALATWACLTSTGRLLAPLALLDTTERVWRGEDDSQGFLDLCAELNRHPQGYVIADAALIAANAGEFQAVVNPGLRLTPEESALLDRAGLPVITAPDLARLDTLVPCDVRYQGEGRPHFQRRRLPDGGTLVAVANIEDGRLITGEITIGQGSFALELYPGEIAFFAPSFADHRAPTRPAAEPVWLPLEHDVEWGSENSLPLVRWVSPAGRPCTLSDSESVFLFRWETGAGVRNLTLRVPESCRHPLKRISLDGVALDAPVATAIFDDAYGEYRIRAGEVPGWHTLSIEKHDVYARWDNRLPWTERILLTGEFDVELRTDNPFYQRYATPYNLAHYIPEKAEVRLHARSRRLRTDCSWTEQGHPFYSGLATYVSAIDIPPSWGNARVVLPDVGAACEIAVNDRPPQKRLWHPYEVDVGAERGACRVRITVNNTLANALEGYRAPSGILARGYCQCRAL